MVQAVNIGQLLGAIGQLQQVNAENRRIKDAKEEERRAGISGTLSTVGTVAGGIIGGAYGGPGGAMMGSAIGGAAGSAVGGMVGGKQMTGQQAAQHGAQIYGAYASREQMIEQQRNTPAGYSFREKPVLDSQGNPTKQTVTVKVPVNAEGVPIGGGDAVPASQIQSPEQPKPSQQYSYTGADGTTSIKTAEELRNMPEFALAGAKILKLGDQPKVQPGVKSITYDKQDGKTFKVSAVNGEEVSREEMKPKDVKPAVVRTEEETVEKIVNGKPVEVTQVTNYGEDDNIISKKQIKKPASGDTGGKTQAERNFNFMGGIVDKINAGESVSKNDMMRYRTLWMKTARETQTVDAAGNKMMISDSGYPSLNELQNMQQQGQRGGGAVPVSGMQPQGGGVSPISAAQAGQPVSTPYSETVQVGERTWQKASNNDFETMKSLGQYATALNVMGDTAGDMAWGNYFAVAGDTGNDFVKWVVKKSPQSLLNVAGIEPGAKSFVAAYTNQVLAMQQMVKGNPSDRDIGFMLASTAEPTNDPEYNKNVIDYNKTQVRSAMKMKLEMMLSEKKRITPEMENVARNAGINMDEVRSAMNKNPRDIYDSNMNSIREQHAQFASQSGDNYKPKSSMEVGGQNGQAQTVVGRPAEYLVSTDNRLFGNVSYTPQMVKEIVRDKNIFEKLNKHDKIKLLKSFETGMQ